MLPRLLALSLLALSLLTFSSCRSRARVPYAGPSAITATGERVRALSLYPDVTATIVTPPGFDPRKHVELILYALPNGNSTAETMGRALADSVGWRYDIQHIAAQTRAARDRHTELQRAVVVYLEAANKSWPEWRRVQGYDRANARIVAMVNEIRADIGNPVKLSVTLTGHSGGGSFTWGFIDGQTALPDWLTRIGFLDSNYSFEPRHGTRISEWLKRDTRHTLVVLAYDDREIMLDGKKVVTDSGGTWRATHRMLDALALAFRFTSDTLGAFLRYRAPGIELLLHPNPSNRILHTEMIGEMNGYLHALLVARPGYDDRNSVLTPARAYTKYVTAELALPAAVTRAIPARAAGAKSGTAFMTSITSLTGAAREEAIRAELLAGNIPSFLRTLQTVRISAKSADSVMHTVEYEVMPDYLAVGSDKDFVRIPMTPYTAQAFGDAFGFVLPTRRMVNDIWAAATTHLEPLPLTEAREASATFLQHHRMIEQQLAGTPRGAFVAGIKKDVVMTPLLASRPGKVAIYGWHYTTGVPIQPLYTGHVDWYVDYSHGVRPVRRAMRVDGVPMSYERILADPTRHTLLSDEGPIPSPRYN